MEADAEQSPAAAIPAAAAAAVGRSKATAGSAFLQGSLFGSEVLAEAGPGSVALENPSAKPHSLAGNGTMQQQGAGITGGSSEFVPLLFGTPAPGAVAAAASRSGRGGIAAAVADVGGSLFGGVAADTPYNAETPAGGGLVGLKTPGASLQAPGLFAMSEEEFGRDVLGIGGKGATTTATKAAAAAAGGAGSVGPAAAGTGGYGGGSTAGRRSSKRQKQTPVRR
jgi:hypothetical protein